MTISEKSDNPNQPAIQGDNTAGGDGVLGKGRRGVVGVSDDFQGVYGKSRDNAGVYGVSKPWCGVCGESQENAGVRGVGQKGVGVSGTSANWHGVYGETESTIGGAGVWGENKNGTGIVGKSNTGIGIFGESQEGTGVSGTSEKWHGVYGETKSTIGGAGVWGENKNGTGIVGKSNTGIGVLGISETYEGIHAETKSTSTAAMAVYQLNPNSDTAALYAKHAGNRTAAVFEGNVIVTGDITLANADFAEDFTILDVVIAEPGTVMVINDDGVLQPSEHAYDRRVAGVISGAGEYKPAIVLDKQQPANNRLPIALVGKVYCKVDAQYGAIKVGDLLTTSPTPGHAMKVADPQKAFGAVIGKALRPLQEGQGLMPILIALQ